jgi:hypothetical protein
MGTTEPVDALRHIDDRDRTPLPHETEHAPQSLYRSANVSHGAMSHGTAAAGTGDDSAAAHTDSGSSPPLPSTHRTERVATPLPHVAEHAPMSVTTKDTRAVGHGARVHSRLAGGAVTADAHSVGDTVTTRAPTPTPLPSRTSTQVTFRRWMPTPHVTEQSP